MISAALSYEQAQSEAALEQENFCIAEGKRAAGMITEFDYQNQQITASQSSLKEESAKLDLLEAIETYCWSVKGLAAAE